MPFEDDSLTREADLVQGLSDDLTAINPEDPEAVAEGIRELAEDLFGTVDPKLVDPQVRANAFVKALLGDHLMN